MDIPDAAPVVQGLGFDPAVLQQRKEEFREVAEKFEAVLINELVKAMEKTLPSGGLFPADMPGADTYEGLLSMHLSETLAARGIGLGRSLEGQFPDFSPSPSGATDKS